MTKILLIEDDAIQIELIKSHLEPEGYFMIVAKNGQEGIRIAKKEKPDLILMDMIMPGMHGLEATIRLKEDPETADIPILALTIVSSPKFVQECYRAGIVGYIKKPYDPRVLLDTMERIVGKPEKRFSKIMLIAGASRLATMIEMRLSRQGYQVISFAGGKSALNYLERDRPDAIFLDVSLPEKHVSKVFAELGKLKTWRKIPVVIFSPHLSPEAIETGVTLWGAQGFISSAADIGVVLRKIQIEAEG
ncbi:MAG: response regulator [Acidobacteriota bacterium]